MKEIRGSLILTRLSWILCIDFQMNDPSPFSQSLWQHLRQPYVAIQTTERPRQTSRINSPPRIHIVKLVYRISPPILNCFLQFQRCCNLLIQTFPTMYDTSQQPQFGGCRKWIFVNPIKKSIPVVGFLTCNDCDVLRAKTGGYRRFTHRTIIPPTPHVACQQGVSTQSHYSIVAELAKLISLLISEAKSQNVTPLQPSESQEENGH